MRRLFFSLLFAFSLLPVFAQQKGASRVHFGVKGGVNISQVSLKGGVFSGSNRSGFLVGPTLELKLPISFLSMDFAVLYDSYKMRMEKDETSISQMVHYIDVPVNLSLSFGWERMCKFYLSTGPQLAFNLGSTHVLDGNYSLDNTMLSWNAGLGVRILSHYHIGYTYNIGIGHTAELTTHDLTTANMGNWLHNANHKISFTYFF